MQMIFTHGFFHADPHPGNIVLLPGNVIGLLDFGMVGRIDERLREDIEDMLLAIVQHDVPMLVRIIKRLGQTPPQLDEAGLANDVADFVGHYSTQAAGAVRRRRRPDRHDRDHPPLPDHAAAAGGDADQGAGHARRHGASCSARSSA